VYEWSTPTLAGAAMAIGGLILLDGLDEVPDALQRREKVKRAVQDFAALHSQLNLAT